MSWINRELLNHRELLLLDWLETFIPEELPIYVNQLRPFPVLSPCDQTSQSNFTLWDILDNLQSKKDDLLTRVYEIVKLVDIKDPAVFINYYAPYNSGEMRFFVGQLPPLNHEGNKIWLSSRNLTFKDVGLDRYYNR
jgi:hypothetical protein